MSDKDRAAAIAERILHDVKPTGYDVHPSEIGVVIAALRAYALPPADVREAVARAILTSFKANTNAHGVSVILNEYSVADEVLSTLQAAEWGPRPETPAARGVLADPWKPMSEAPTDGKHVLLACKFSPFVYAVQGAFQDGAWNTAAGDDFKPLAWMKIPKIPNRFLPWTDEGKAAIERIDRKGGGA